MERINLTWKQAKPLLEIGDVLLFRGSSWTSKWLKWAGHGHYSHAGLVDRCNGFVEILEYREWRGGRSVSLEGEVNKYPGEIDVFRLHHSIEIPVYNNGEVRNERKFLEAFGRKAIALEMHKLTGNDYSWKRIWKLAKYHIPVLRWFQSASLDDKAENPENLCFVCSTAVAYCIRKHWVDPTPNLSDFEVDPSTLSRSAIMSYLFTLNP